MTFSESFRVFAMGNSKMDPEAFVSNRFAVEVMETCKL